MTKNKLFLLSLVLIALYPNTTQSANHKQFKNHLGNKYKQVKQNDKKQKNGTQKKLNNATSTTTNSN